MRELKQQRRRSKRERQKSNRFRLAKQRLYTCITRFCKFPCRHCTSTTWKWLISRYVEDMNTRRLPFSFPELRYSLLDYNSCKNCQYLTNWTRWNKRDKVWRSATSLVKWRFRNRRRRCYLSPLLGTLTSEDGNCRENVAEKWIRVLSIFIAITLSHWLCEMWANPPKDEFLRTVSKFRKRKEISSSLVYFLCTTWN